MPRKTRAGQIVEAALSRIEDDADETHTGIDWPVRFDAEQRARDQAWDEAAARGKLGPVAKAFHEGKSLRSHPAEFGKILRDNIAAKRTKEAIDKAIADQTKSETAFAEFQQHNPPDSDLSVSRTTRVSVPLLSRIAEEFERAHAAGEKLSGNELARRLNVSGATVSHARSIYLEQCMKEGRTPPSWAITTRRRHGHRRRLAE